MKLIVDKRVFVSITDWYDYKCTYCDENVNQDNFYLLFTKLCNNIKVLMNQQIPINITIYFEHMKQHFDKLYSLFAAELKDEKWIDKYKQPKCNNTICLPSVNPQISFCASVSDIDELIASNCVSNS